MMALVMAMPRLMVGRVHPVGRNLTEQLIYISVVTYLGIVQSSLLSGVDLYI